MSREGAPRGSAASKDIGIPKCNLGTGGDIVYTRCSRGALCRVGRTVGTATERHCYSACADSSYLEIGRSALSFFPFRLAPAARERLSRLMRPLLLFTSLIASSLLAQTPTPSSAPAQPDTVIHAGTLLDRPGKEPRRNASILIAKGKIVSVQDGFTKPSDGVTLIDLKDRFVLPGLIDCHVHLTSDRAGVEGQLAGVTDSAARVDSR